jgi:hypothetical protein
MIFETSLKQRECDAASQQEATSCSRGKTLFRVSCSTEETKLEVRRAPSGWRVGIYPRTADLPILSRCEVIALDHHEALLMAKDRVDGVMSL